MERLHPGDGRTPRTSDDQDSGLSALRQATVAYVELQNELFEERREATTLSHENAALKQELEQLRQRQLATRAKLEADLEAERRRASREAERAAALTTALSALHHSLYAGGTAQLLLRACLQITTATRGYFVETPAMRIRAVDNVPATMGSPPSPFVESICRRVVESGEALQWNSELPPDGVTPSTDEQFREGIAVLVAVHGAPRGVIIALDKAEGEFQPDDVRTLVSIGSEAGIAVENAELRDQVQHAYVSTVALLADTIEAKDAYTSGHCARVSLYARAAARRLGLEDEEMRVTCYAALLHDVGKIGVSDGLLNKPGPLLDEERLMMQAHVRIGYDLLRRLPALEDVAFAVLHHHEAWDGRGYPDALSGTAIPMASRIVAVCDAYCAMLDRRSYKDALTPAHARAELQRCAGTQFDPTVVEAVLAAIDEVDGSGDPLDDPGCGLLPSLVCRAPELPDLGR